MNNLKHERFIVAMDTFYSAKTSRMKEFIRDKAKIIAKRLVDIGIAITLPVRTAGGDRVRIHTIDPLHTFPLIGEVVDSGSGQTWLARWSKTGRYASDSPDAVRQHSLENNIPVRIAAESLKDAAEAIRQAPARRTAELPRHERTIRSLGRPKLSEFQTGLKDAAERIDPAVIEPVHDEPGEVPTTKPVAVVKSDAFRPDLFLYSGDHTIIRDIEGGNIVVEAF